MDSKRKKSVSLAESADQRRSRASSIEKRGTTLRVSTVNDRPPKFTTKFKSLIDDYTKIYKEHQELVKESAKLQNGIARYFKEHLQVPQDNKKGKVETKEEKERNAGEAEEEHQRRYESGFRVVKDLTKKIAVTKEEAAARNEKMKSAAAAKETGVQSAWTTFEAKETHFAKTALTRDGQTLNSTVIVEHLDKITNKLREWREVGMRGTLIWKKKQDMEEQLRKLDNFGGDMSLNRYDELKAMGRLHQERNEDSVKDLEAARSKHAHSSQVVAHLSEKVFYLGILKKELGEKLEWLEKNLDYQREKLNRTKMTRDEVRREGQTIKERTGIMFSPILLHDLEGKIKLRNDLIRELGSLNNVFAAATAVDSKRALPVDPTTHMRNMARGNLLLLPEIVEDEESMNIICNYDGKKNIMNVEVLAN